MANVQIRSFGGLNTDTHVQDLRNGDYPDAKNIDHISAETGESVAVTPRMGNEYAFDLGEVTPQNKEYIIVFPDVFPSGGYEISVKRSDRSNDLFPPFNIDSFSNAIVDIQSAFGNGGFYDVTVVEAYTVYPQYAGQNALVIVPELTQQSLLYYDYFIESTGVNTLSIETSKESISTSRCGLLEVIGSKDLLGDLFIISSSKRDKPFELAVDNIQIVNISGQNVLLVTPFQTSDVILDGQEVYITGVQGIDNANGIFVINVVQDPQNGNTLLLLYNAFADPTQTYVPNTGVIKFNYLGMGEIGVAQKDISSNTWKYTRLLRSKELNLFTYHQCDVQGEKSFNRKSIYFTDFNDVPRNFYYKIDVPYYTDGALAILYPESGYYNYGSISDQTNHILGQPSLDIDFISQAQGGGSLYAGNHVYFARGVLGDGSYTDWSLPSRYVPVYSAITTGDPKNIIGNISGSQTDKLNQIRISNIRGDVYSYIEVACINYLDIGFDPTVYGIFARRPVTKETTELIINHTGRETGQELNQDELGVQTETYTKAKNNAIIDNRYLLSNLETPGDDLAEILGKVKYSIKTKQISKPRFQFFQKFGGHQDPFNVFYYGGYMMNETYRIGARVRYKNGYTSPVYALFDATIDTDQTSADGKRLQGLSSYDLNALGTTGIDPATGYPYPQDVVNLVPYLEIQGPNLGSEIINGVPANLVIERIEYFRAEVLNPTIVGSGYAVMHVKCITSTTNYAPRYRRVDIGSAATISLTHTLPTYTQDNSSPIGSNPMVSYEFPFVLGNDSSQESQLYDIPVDLNYYDTRFTIDSGPRLGTNYGYKWNDRFASIYLVDQFLNDNSQYISVGAGTSVINLGQLSTFKKELSPTQPSNRFSEFYSLNTDKEVVGIEESLYVPNGDPLKLSTDWVAKSIGITPSTTTNPTFTIEDATNIDNQLNIGFPFNTFNLFANGSYSYIYGFSDNPTEAPGFSMNWNGSFGSGDQSMFIQYFNQVNISTGITCSAYGGTGLIFTAPNTDIAWNNYEIVIEYQYFFSDYGAEFRFKLTAPAIDQTNKRYSFYPGYIAKLNNTLSSFSGSNYKLNDTGIRAIQIKRDLAGSSQYSEEGLDQYVYTGAFQNSSSTNVVDVFGGDTLTTQIYVKSINQNEDPSAPITGGFTTGMLLTSQTKSNPYLIYEVDGDPLYPVTYNSNDIITNLFDWLNKRTLDTYNYNYGYSINSLGTGYRAGVTKDRSFKMPTRVIWSDSKPQNARSDFYRRFGILSYNDLDASFGEINSMKNVNGELFTLQVSKFQKQFFNARGTLQVSDGSQVVLGDAGVFSRPGITITSYGCSDKWSAFLGKSSGGDDVLYWYDSINKKFMRFGADGAVPISDRTNIRTLANDGFKWVVNYQTPADNYGIHGIWNQRLNEAAWTCRAYRMPDVLWDYGIAINEGELVIVEESNATYGFERFPIIYKCIQANVGNDNNKPGEGIDYEQYYITIPFDDIEYYSLRTIVWSEVKNKFIISDETPHPRIYLQYKDTFLSPSPSAYSNKLFEHNEGEYLHWYIYNRFGQREDGYIDIVFNIDPNTTKHFISLICNTEIVPYKVEAFTKNHSTVINPVEFLEQLDQYVAPIPNNLENGSTGMDNTFLYGQWIKVRFHYKDGMFQRLTNMILKYNPMARLWNS